MPSFWELAKYKSNDTKSLRFYFSYDSAASWPLSLPPRFVFNSEIFWAKLGAAKTGNRWVTINHYATQLVSTLKTGNLQKEKYEILN